MKRLQYNFTTPEQSKRLLELGVPADSADCTRNLKTGLILAIPFKPSLFKERKEFWLNAYPCWSVGRLMEIYSNIRNKSITINANAPMVESIIETMESDPLLDFSKLEE